MWIWVEVGGDVQVGCDGEQQYVEYEYWSVDLDGVWLWDYGESEIGVGVDEQSVQDGFQFEMLMQWDLQYEDDD